MYGFYSDEQFCGIEFRFQNLRETSEEFSYIRRRLGMHIIFKEQSTIYDLSRPTLTTSENIRIRSPKNRQITQKNHNHLSKQQAVATQIPNQFKQKLVTIFI